MLNVFSEISPLKTVLMHRPGAEIENLIPSLLSEFLYEDIPYLKFAQEEHDAFAQVLRNQGVEVVYLETLAAESLNSYNKETFLREYLSVSGIRDPNTTNQIISFLDTFSHKELILKMISGILISEIYSDTSFDLKSFHDDDPFMVYPMPNIMYQRDPFVTIGNGAAIANLSTSIRSKEALLSKLILMHHPAYKIASEHIYFNDTNDFNLEGGDVLILNPRTIVVGISKRTHPVAVEQLAKKVLSQTSFEKVIALKIPRNRAFMHLDTILTQVNNNQFLYHKNVFETTQAYIFKLENAQLAVSEKSDSIQVLLSNQLELDVQMIPCGGSDIISSAREQWNDGANSLAIQPGKIVTYERNHQTNKALGKAGIEVIEIKASELSRGRGGPHCLTMPLIRE